jgi:methyl-accepting chemotaxis protein
MLKNLKIRNKLRLMIVAPLLGLSTFALWNIKEHNDALQGLVQTEMMTKLAVEVGALSHELQKERGYSSGYINAKGQKFREELAGQREQVNLGLKRVQAFMSLHSEALGAASKSMVAAEASIAKIQDIRRDMDTLKLSGADSYSFYTGLIGSYLDVVAAIATTSGNSEVMRKATAYYGFIMAKEEAGKERATLNAVLAVDRFDEEKFQRVLDIGGAHKTYLELFRKYGSAAALAAWDEKAKSEAFRKAKEIRAAVLAKGVAGGFGIAPEEWFKVITAKIDAMKEVEDQLSAEILATAGGLAADAKKALAAAVLFTVALVAITLGLGFVVMLGITHPLSEMQLMLKDIAEGEGDLTRRLRVDRKDELGEVSLWFNRFVDNVHGIVSQLAGNTQQVSASCHQLNQTADQIATGAEEVACQSGTVATASEEMSATSMDISNNCMQAAASSNRASDTAKGGGGGGSSDPAGHAEHRRQRPGVGPHRGEPWREVGPDRRHRRNHRGHSGPDQPAGAKRRHRGGSCRRTGARFRSGGGRSACSGGTDDPSHQGDRRDDQDHPGRDQRSRGEHGTGRARGRKRNGEFPEIGRGAAAHPASDQ